MRKRTYRLASSLLLALLAAAITLGPAQARETPYLSAISFANTRDGWVAGHTTHQAFILHTTNGGRSWAQRTTRFDAQQMQFISSRDGWVVGFTPLVCGPGKTSAHSVRCRWVIEATHDGGATWMRQLQVSPCWQISSLDFITSSEGWALESNDACASESANVSTRIVGTADGGRTWRVAFAPALQLTGVHFGTPLQGWAVADDLAHTGARCRTVLYHTSDGGRTWASQFTLRGACSGWVDFVDGLHGWLLVTNVAACSMSGCYDTRLYHTVDGGQHWLVEQQVKPTDRATWFGGSGFAHSFLFVTPSVGYMPVSAGAGGGFGGIGVTQDGGRHWVRKQPFGLEAGDLSPVSGSEAWATGCTQHTSTCNVLLHTTNAGHSWSRQPVG